MSTRHFWAATGTAYATAIAVDAAGRAYVAGNENEICSTGYTFPVLLSNHQRCGNRRKHDRRTLAPIRLRRGVRSHRRPPALFHSLRRLEFRLPGGCGGTYGTGVAVDRNGYFYLIGETQAGKLPTTAGVIQPSGAPLDATWSLCAGLPRLHREVQSGHFRQRGIAGLRHLPWRAHSYPGDYISGIAIDSASNAYVVGYTNSKDFPVTPGAYQTVCGPNGQNLRGGPRDQTESVRQRHPLVHLRGRRQARWKRLRVLYRPHPIGRERQHLYHWANRRRTGFPDGESRRAAPPAGPSRCWSPSWTPRALTCCFPPPSDPAGSTPTNPAGLAVDPAGNIYLAGNTNGPDLITTPGAFQTTSGDGPCCHRERLCRQDRTNPLPARYPALSRMARRMLPEDWCRDPGRR